MWRDERDIARAWWGLLPGSLLPLSDGRRFRLLFSGIPGGASGPDVCDAVLCAVKTGRLADEQRSLLPSDPSQKTAMGQRAAGDHAPAQPATQWASGPWRKPITSGDYAQGSVEFHLRASDWYGHGHHLDPRYNTVVLHVVGICDDLEPTRRQDGQVVPNCCIRDFPLRTALPVPPPPACAWPCHVVMSHLDPDEQTTLLRQAGLLRFEQKSHAFVEQLHQDQPDDYDRCLLPALAEGLGYGRDRAFFRAVGLRLAGYDQSIPEPLGRTLEPAPLDAARLRVLRHLVVQWGMPGMWVRLRSLLMAESDSPVPLLGTVRRLFRDAGLSLERADILICNVVLPFAAAVALLEHDLGLGECARALYCFHPGLPSNRITRMMSAQLLLPDEPSGSCQQQGLHYIYQQSCREKRCEDCLVGKRDI